MAFYLLHNYMDFIYISKYFFKNKNKNGYKNKIPELLEAIYT